MLLTGSAIDHATIHDDRLTGHIVAVGTRQEGHQSRDISGSLSPTKGNGANKCVEGLALLGIGLLRHFIVYLDPHVSGDNAGAIGIDCDPVGSKFLGRRLGQGPNREFGGIIRPEHGKTLLSRNRRGADDLALGSGCTEGLGRCLDSPKHALGIHGIKLVNLFFGDGGDGIDRRDTGIVDHDVQRTKLCHAVGYGGKEPDRVC